MGLSLSIVKRLRDKIRFEGDICRVEASGRSTKLNADQENFAIEWLQSNLLLSNKKLCSKVANKYFIEISHDTITRILGRYGFSWKSLKIIFKKDPGDWKNRIDFCKQNRNLNFDNVFFSEESTFYSHYPGKSRWINPGEIYTQTKTKYTK